MDRFILRESVGFLFPSTGGPNTPRTEFLILDRAYNDSVIVSEMSGDKQKDEKGLFIGIDKLRDRMVQLCEEMNRSAASADAAPL